MATEDDKRWDRRLGAVQGADIAVLTLIALGAPVTLLGLLFVGAGAVAGRELMKHKKYDD